MPKARNPTRKDPNIKFKCKICHTWKSGKYFYKSHKTLNCVTCLRNLRIKQGGICRRDITINPTKGNFMKMFKYVINQLYRM